MHLSKNETDYLVALGDTVTINRLGEFAWVDLIDYGMGVTELGTRMSLTAKKLIAVDDSCYPPRAKLTEAGIAELNGMDHDALPVILRSRLEEWGEG